VTSGVGGAVGTVVATVGSVVGVSGVSVGSAVTGMGTVVEDGSGGVVEVVGGVIVGAVVGLGPGAVVFSVVGRVVAGAAVVARLTGATVVATPVAFSVGVRVAVGDTAGTSGVRFRVGCEATVATVPGVPGVAVRGGPPGRPGDRVATGPVLAGAVPVVVFATVVVKAAEAAVDTGDIVCMITIAGAAVRCGVGVAVRSAAAVVAAEVGPGVGIVGVRVAPGGVVGVPARSGANGTPLSVGERVAFSSDGVAFPCMSVAISGGRSGAANPTTKSTMQATTPTPIRPLKIRSPSIGSCDWRSKG
jgi:hypothetical protein